MTSQTKRPIMDRVLNLSTIDAIAAVLGRYGRVVVIGWIGALKFANFEAYQIQPPVANSPFMGWLYDFLPVYTFSALLGVVELAAAVLLAIKPLAPRLSTPGSSEPAGGGFPALSLTGEFLLKDIPLLWLSFWALADAMRAIGRQSAGDHR